MLIGCTHDRGHTIRVQAYSKLQVTPCQMSAKHEEPHRALIWKNRHVSIVSIEWSGTEEGVFFLVNELSIWLILVVAMGVSRIRHLYGVCLAIVSVSSDTTATYFPSNNRCWKEAAMLRRSATVPPGSRILPHSWGYR